jgi:hypothetical protein
MLQDVRSTIALPHRRRVAAWLPQQMHRHVPRQVRGVVPGSCLGEDEIQGVISVAPLGRSGIERSPCRSLCGEVVR